MVALDLVWKMGADDRLRGRAVVVVVVQDVRLAKSGNKFRSSIQKPLHKIVQSITLVAVTR